MSQAIVIDKPKNRLESGFLKKLQSERYAELSSGLLAKPLYKFNMAISDLGKDYWSTVGKVEVISPNSWHKSNISITLPPGTYILGYKAHGNISANAYINTKIDNAAESFPLYEKEINMPLSIADGSTLRSVSNVVMRLNNSEVTLYFWAYSTIVTSITCEVWAIRIK